MFHEKITFTFFLTICALVSKTQISFVVQADFLPSILVSSEKYYFEYFGESEVQPMVQYGARIGLDFKERWQVLIGAVYHQRKMSTDCLFIPQQGMHISNSTLPQVSNSLCTHTTKRDYQIVEIPVSLSYLFTNQGKLLPFASVGFSPIKRIKYHETRRQIDNVELYIDDRSFSSGRYQFIFFSLICGTYYRISQQTRLMLGINYKFDDKTIRDNTIGIAIGAQRLIR